MAPLLVVQNVFDIHVVALRAADVVHHFADGIFKTLSEDGVRAHLAVHEAPQSASGRGRPRRGVRRGGLRPGRVGPAGGASGGDEGGGPGGKRAGHVNLWESSGVHDIAHLIMSSLKMVGQKDKQ